MRNANRFSLVAIAAALGVALWAPVAHSQAPNTQVAAAQPSAAPAASRALTLDEYKKHAATHIVASSANLFATSLPPILKSVVVLDITVDAEGNVTRLSLWRSNGYEDVEAVAMDSVRRAGKLPAPSPQVLAGQTSVRFLETWLFRPDNRFQVRSAVPQPPSETASDVAAKKKPRGPS
jgi:periplasmic protein TonB